MNVLKLMDQINVETKGSLDGRSIVESFSLGEDDFTKDEDSYPVFYVFNFNDEKGYAIATSDNRMPPVFCITEKGRFSPDSLIIPEGAAILLSALEDEYRRVTADGVRSGDSLDIIDPPGGYPTLVDTWYVYTDWEMGTVYGSRLDCNWGQRAPFNAQCPYDDSIQCPVGCLATALGQIMYHWGVNTTYNGHSYDWYYMHDIIDRDTDETLYHTGWEMVQNLMIDIGRSENLAMTYEYDGSHAPTVNISRTFQHFGYLHGGTETELHNNYDVLKDDLMNNRPVMGYGCSYDETSFFGLIHHYSGSHEWVYDQCCTQSRERYTYNIYSDGSQMLVSTAYYNRKLVHCNWGWNGNHNGFYLLEDYDTVNDAGIITRSSTKSDHDKYYHYCLLMQTGISPN